MRDTWTTGIELNAVYSRAWRPTNLFRSVIIAISRGLPLRITANGVCSHAEIAKPTADCRFGTPAWKSETAAPGEMLISRFVTRRFPFVIDQFLLDDIHTRPRASIVTSDLVFLIFLIFLRFPSFLFLFFLSGYKHVKFYKRVSSFPFYFSKFCLTSCFLIFSLFE